VRNKNQRDSGKKLLTNHSILSNLEALLLLGQHRLQLSDPLSLGLSSPLSKGSGLPLHSQLQPLCA
jgi:hypothetical protein